MPKPYSEDLRWQAVWLNVVCGMSSIEIADLLFMSERTVHRYLDMFTQLDQWHLRIAVVALVKLLQKLNNLLYFSH